LLKQPSETTINGFGLAEASNNLCHKWQGEWWRTQSEYTAFQSTLQVLGRFYPDSPIIDKTGLGNKGMRAYLNQTGFIVCDMGFDTTDICQYTMVTITIAR
jgi:hypothetical protein